MPFVYVCVSLARCTDKGTIQTFHLDFITYVGYPFIGRWFPGSET